MQSHYQATLQQGIDFLLALEPEQYTALCEVATSPIGGHIRHILDHFFSVRLAADRVQLSGMSVVDYERRQRGSKLESDCLAAVDAFRLLQHWIVTLAADQLAQPVIVNADVGIGSTNIVQVPSTLGRELMFCCSHAIHHYALLKSIFQSLGGEMPSTFGLAPSTASYQRSLECAP